MTSTGPAAAQAEPLAVARARRRSPTEVTKSTRSTNVRAAVPQHDDHLAARRGDLRGAAGAGQPHASGGGSRADHRGVDVAEPVELGGAEEADVDAAGLQPVVEDLRHADHGVGGLGQLAVPDGQWRHGRAWRRSCRTRRSSTRSAVVQCGGPGWPRRWAARCRRSRRSGRPAPGPRRPSSSRRRSSRAVDRHGALTGRRRTTCRSSQAVNVSRSRLIASHSPVVVVVAVVVALARTTGGRRRGTTATAVTAHVGSTHRARAAGRARPRPPRPSPATRRAASTASFWTPVMPHICTLPRRSARWAWMTVTSGLSAGTAVSTSPVNGQVIGAIVAVCRGQVGADVAAQHGERQPGRAGGVPVGHAGVAVLLQLAAAPGQPCSTASRSRCSEPTPGLPPQEKTSSLAQPAPIIWS